MRSTTDCMSEIVVDSESEEKVVFVLERREERDVCRLKSRAV